MERNLLIIGHRGAAGLAPENTLTAFNRAIELGVDAVELDVLLSADGELMVHHDFALKPDIARDQEGNWVTDNRNLTIQNLTADQLKIYDVGRLKPGGAYGSRYPRQQPADGARIPTLKEVMDLMKRQSAMETALWIEIKTTPENTELTPTVDSVVASVVEKIRVEGFSARTRVLAFDWRVLTCLKRMAPEIPALYLTLEETVGISCDPETAVLWTGGVNPGDFDNSVPDMVRAAGGRYWAAQYTQLTMDQVREAHNIDIQVYAWTVDVADDMRRLIAMGVDGIITNRPDVLISLLEH